MKLLVLDSNIWNYLTVETIAMLVCKWINSNSFKNETIHLQIIYVGPFKCMQNDWF